MTFQEYFDSFKEKMIGADVNSVTEHLAFQFNIEDKDCGGIFYVEVKDGELHIEPYEYFDRDAIFICTPSTLDKIIAGKADPVAAFTMQKLKVEGDLGKALRLKEMLPKKGKKSSK